LSAMLVSGKNVVAPPVAPVIQTQIASQPVVSLPGAVAAPPVAVAQPVLGADAAYFHQELSPYGRWILAEDNQWYWQPTVALTAPDWRPYWDKGHWVYTDHGWYWASDYTWGWAVFHYGRWHLHPRHGWIWFPDRLWGPAWVTWRAGGDYCGWAPLPPGAVYDQIGGGFIFRGKRVAVGFDFGLDWMHFSFSLVREMGEPPRAHLRKEEEIRAVFKQTTILNNYTVVKAAGPGAAPPRLFNHGLDPGRVASVRKQAVDTMRIEELRAPPPNRSHEHFDAKTKTLQVYRPRWGGH
jgi:hypothetical protein